MKRSGKPLKYMNCRRLIIEVVNHKLKNISQVENSSHNIFDSSLIINFIIELRLLLLK